MTRSLILVVVFVSFAAVQSFAQVTTGGNRATTLCSPVVPEDAQLERYPLASGQLSMTQVADLRLQPVRLMHAFKALNFYRDLKVCGGGTWRLEIIPAGELVLVDPVTKYVAYRESCGNRLVWQGEMPAQPTPQPVVVQPPATPNPVARLWAWMWSGPQVYPWWWRKPMYVEVTTTGGNAHVIVSQ